MNQPSLLKIEPLGLTLEELLRKREDDIINSLSHLSFPEALDLVRQVPWSERARVILLSPYPEAIVKNLHPMELFLTLKASSLDLAVELITYTKGSQVQFFFDLDAWYKDRIKPERVASWLILLFEAGEDRVLEWLRVADWDFLVALLQKFLKVSKRPDDLDLLEAYDQLPPYTLDDVYFIEFKVPRLEYYFRRMIEILREEHPETYFSLLESVIWEIPLEVEERAYKFRTARLEDEGLVDYFSALEIYTPLHPKALRKLEAGPLFQLEGEVAQPLFLPLPQEGGFLFEKVLSQVDVATRERIKRELSYLATKLILTDFVVIDGTKELEEGMKKLRASLNLGLDYLSHGQLEVAKDYLRSSYLEDIFRVGQTALRELRRYTLRMINQNNFEASTLRYADDPYQGYLKGILVKDLNRIKLYQPERVGTDEEYTYFSWEVEIKMVWRYMEEVMYLAALLEKGFGGVSSWVKEMLKPGRNFDLINLTWSALVLTSLFQWVHSGNFVFQAVPRSAWKKLFPKLLEKAEKRCVLKRELQETLFKNFITLAKHTYYVEEAFIEGFVKRLVQRLNHEFAFAEPQDPPDPKYQTLILIDLKN